MGMVPGFKHDVFVSFAWVDNKERLPGEPRSRWIDTLKEALTVRLADRMRPDPVSLWLDAKDVEGNLPLDEILRGAAGNSALFLLVLSENYLQSRYCRDELEAFLRQAGGDEKAKGRIFVVLREAPPLASRPKSIQNLVGYPFYRRHPVTEELEVFGDPLPAAKLPAEYSETVQDLVDAIEKQLRSMKQAPGGAGTTPKPAVLLAECTPDLGKVYKQVRTHLEDAGYRVVPDERLSHAPPGYEQKFADAAAQAKLFVQILGPFHDDPLPPAFPLGFERWQFDRAQQAGLETLQWRRRDLTAEQLADDPAHQAFVFDPSVIAGELEELKSILIDRAQAAANRRDRPDGEPRVLLLHVASTDETLAQSVGQEVEDLCAELQIGTVYADVVPADLSLEEVTNSNPNFHGMVVIYGQAERQWVEQQADVCRRLALKYQRQKPVCALYLGPPDPKPQLRLPARFERITHGDQPRLRAFLARLAGRNA